MTGTSVRTTLRRADSGLSSAAGGRLVRQLDVLGLLLLLDLGRKTQPIQITGFRSRGPSRFSRYSMRWQPCHVILSALLGLTLKLLEVGFAYPTRVAHSMRGRAATLALSMTFAFCWTSTFFVYFCLCPCSKPHRKLIGAGSRRVTGSS